MPGYRCAACLKKRHAADIFECAGCIGGVYYCNERCQRAHWPTHAAVCALVPTSSLLAAGGGVDDVFNNPEDHNDAVLQAFMSGFADTEEYYEAAENLAATSAKMRNYVNTAFKYKYALNIGPLKFAPLDEAADSAFDFETRWIRRYRDVMAEFWSAIDEASQKKTYNKFWVFMFQRHATVLFENALTPSERRNICSEHTIKCDFNNVRELPREIGALTRLRRLYLRGNQLRELPREIGALTRLLVLDVAGNQLRELPHEIGALTQLTTLDVTSNQLRELPREIGALARLYALNADNNQLSELPREIGALTRLRVLRARNNQLRELPREIDALTRMRYVFLEHNNLNLDDIARLLHAMPSAVFSFDRE